MNFMLFFLECSTRKVQETNLGLDMNCTNQVFVYVNDLNIVGDIKSVERNVAVLNAFNDIGLTVRPKHRS